jgi:ubiquinone/menaquinone biosynthesis C-methylase UbiE
MSLRSRLFALTYDRQLAKVEREGLADIRKESIAEASGRVLEIGAGTGANLALYGPAVESLTLTDPEPPMLKRLEKRAHEEAPQAKVLRAPAEELPFPDDSFDTAVSTLVLCGVDDQPRALGELRRVLKPGGKLIFVEHVRSDDPGLARKQDRMNGFNHFLVGCDCNRSTLASIEAAGFAVEHVEHTTLNKVPNFISPLIVGTAAAP